ncbi:uncharacterized protein LOC107621002 [Arachis ipaensis]|uniref:uncharacterized protein LOC107621002 n=1 Tax=Arachis ipaensis TaxID=130454 RepID=UPI0007AEFE9A|nr:uncharacterized protein LOC107621002 [Arachis ipaensis]XP_025685340.1 uncharacterized protein LOC112786149 [Arachis hypogaea]
MMISSDLRGDMTEGNLKVSYKESMLTSIGPRLEESPSVMEEVLEDASDRRTDVSKKEFEDWCRPWKSTLVVKVLGKRVGLAFMEQRLQRDWVRKGSLDGGGHYLIVQRWRPFFLTSEHRVRKIAAWVRIPNLPIELYNQRFLWRVGSAIGQMIKIDRPTSIHSRGKFARICVEIDLAKKLVPKISVMGCELNIEYEGLHQICFTCGKYGHRADMCTEAPTNEAPQPKITGEVSHAGVESNQKRNEDQHGNNPHLVSQRDSGYEQNFLDFGP